MSKDYVEFAVGEAQRFLDAATAWVKAHKANEEALEKFHKDHSSPFKSWFKESGALKRASMDLTRALADMRRTK